LNDAASFPPYADDYVDLTFSLAFPTRLRGFRLFDCIGGQADAPRRGSRFAIAEFCVSSYFGIAGAPRRNRRKIV
jgi:hypothetical protein